MSDPLTAMPQDHAAVQRESADDQRRAADLAAGRVRWWAARERERQIVDAERAVVEAAVAFFSRTDCGSGSWASRETNGLLADAWLAVRTLSTLRTGGTDGE